MPNRARKMRSFQMRKLVLSMRAYFTGSAIKALELHFVDHKLPDDIDKGSNHKQQQPDLH